MQSSMALPLGTFAAMDRSAASSKLLAADDLRPLVRSGPIQGNGYGRRGLLSFLLLPTAIAAPDATDSKTAFLQEYVKRSKAKNDKERLDDYYKRNYKDYFEFVEGSLEAQKEEELSESEKGIRNWLRKNKK